MGIGERLDVDHGHMGVFFLSFVFT